MIVITLVRATILWNLAMHYQVGRNRFPTVYINFYYLLSPFMGALTLLLFAMLLL